MEMDEMSKKSWENKNKSYKNYMKYIDNKENKFKLTLIDLLYISNFKGGRASIHEEESLVNEKLKKYSEYLKEINNEFEGKMVGDLTDEELNSLKKKGEKFLQTTFEESTDINGFKASYASAMLHFYFPDLLPILDRHVLEGVNIDTEKKSNGQVKDIEQYYPELINKFYQHLKNNYEKSVREYDKELFIK